MNLRDYQAGVTSPQFGYESFTPALIHHPWAWSTSKLSVLASEAAQSLGELNAASLFIPDIEYFLAMHILKEATMSSRIAARSPSTGFSAITNAAAVAAITKAGKRRLAGWPTRTLARSATGTASSTSTSERSARTRQQPVAMIFAPAALVLVQPWARGGGVGRTARRCADDIEVVADWGYHASREESRFLVSGLRI